MNRREALAAGVASVASATGLAVEPVEASPDKRQIAFLVRIPAHLDPDLRKRVEDEFRLAFQGTEWADVPCIVMPEGYDFEVKELDPPKQSRPCVICKTPHSEGGAVCSSCADAVYASRKQGGIIASPMHF